jgi:YMGG-like Gly-zipper
MRRQIYTAFAAAAALMALAQPASAQQYRSYHDEHVAQYQQCQTARTQNTVGGAALGAILGAVLGSHASANNHRGDGAALGAVVGGVAGGAIGNSAAARNCNQQAQGSYDPYYGQASNQYPDDQPYAEDNYKDDGDLYGGPSDDGYNGNQNQDCRMGQETYRDPYGRQYTQDVMMCRGDDGVWRPER